MLRGIVVLIRERKKTLFCISMAVTRMPQVREMAQSRDLQGTKLALEKAAIKVREAAFTSSG